MVSAVKMRRLFLVACVCLLLAVGVSGLARVPESESSELQPPTSEDSSIVTESESSREREAVGAGLESSDISGSESVPEVSRPSRRRRNRNVPETEVEVNNNNHVHTDKSGALRVSA